MRILLRSDIKLQISAKMYSLNVKDYEVVNKTFDKLHNQEHMIWAENHTLSDYSVFIVWQDTLINDKIIKKEQVVINFRDLNKIMKSDIYSILLQTNIIQAIAKCSYISVLDAVSFFYQWWVYSSHCQHLLTVLHHKQKIFKVTVMSFINSVLYVQ